MGHILDHQNLLRRCLSRSYAWDGRLTAVVGVRRALGEAAGAEVDEVEAVRVEIDDDVLVLDVAVNDPGTLHGHDRLDDVGEPLATGRRLS